MPTDVTVYHDFEVEATERLKRLRRYFPPYLHDSEVIQMFVTVWGEEVSSRLVDQFLAIIRNIRPTTADDTGISLWEELLDLEHNVGDSNDLIRARILAKTVRQARSRIVDIGNVVRFFLTGINTFTISAVMNNTRIPVKSIVGFTVGLPIFIGSLSRSIVDIDPATSEFIVDTPITIHAFALVTQEEVIIDDFSLESGFIGYSDSSVTYSDPDESYGGVSGTPYRFSIFLDISKILDQQALINAVLAARPAHLGFDISSGTVDYDDAGRNYDDASVDYNGLGVIFTV